MKELSWKNETTPNPMKMMTELKAKESNLEEIIVLRTKLEKEIKQFNALRKKDMTDYSLFIVKLQSVMDTLEYQRETAEGSTARFDKEISKVEKLIDQYKAEQIRVCMQRSENLLDRVQKTLNR